MLSVFDVHDCVTRHVHHMEIQRQLIREAMTARELRVGKAIMLMDLTDLNVTPSATGMGILRSCLEIDQAHYPDMLQKTHFVNCKWFFMALWKMISGWLDPVTRAKFQSSGRDIKKIRTALEVDFTPDAIPEMFGGECRCEGGCVHGLNWNKKAPEGCRYDINSITIAARDEFTYSAHCPAKDTVALWQFRVASNDVGFQVTWKSDGSDQEEVIVAHQRVATTQRAARGRFIPKCPGTLTLTFDNKHGRYWNKNVSFIVDPAAPSNTLWEALYGEDNNTVTHTHVPAAASFPDAAVDTPFTSAVKQHAREFAAETNDGVAAAEATSLEASSALVKSNAASSSRPCLPCPHDT